MKTTFILAMCLMLWGCGDPAADEALAPEAEQSGEVFHIVISPNVDQGLPCDLPHEVDLDSSIDWGAKDCRYIYIDNIKVFEKSGAVIFGFRSDGVITWRHVDEK